jgi:hypothetical protein
VDDGGERIAEATEGDCADDGRDDHAGQRRGGEPDAVAEAPDEHAGTGAERRRFSTPLSRCAAARR